MSNPTAPKVFVSHASEDKEKFVKEFAGRLFAAGIEAWYDEWEMNPGDSLVDKIFEEGLKNAQYVVIVLSKISIQKPWVRQEMNVSVVRRIQGNTRIIPVLIGDDFEVPEALKEILWVKIADVHNYDDALRKIVNTIHGVSDKPPLGQPPRHVQLAVDRLPGLSTIETAIFSAACEVCFRTDPYLINPHLVLKEIEGLNLSDGEIVDSLQILHNRHLLEVKFFNGGVLGTIKLTSRGFENYGKFHIPDFDNLVTRVLMSIVNEDLRTNGDIADRNGISPIVNKFILDMLVQRGYIRVLTVFGDIRISMRVHEVTSEGRRFANQVR